MTRAAPAWLADLQLRFGETITAPLDRSGGVFRATTEAYGEELTAEVSAAGPGGGAARLAVYNRQYWFRLFTVLQDAFPLTARLVGYWNFNEQAARFLEEHPPRGWDLDEVPDRFAPFLVTRDVPAVVIESARLDAAWRQVFRAPEVSPFRPSADDAVHLLGARLQRSAAVAFVEESFALTELRAAVLKDPALVRLDTPPALSRSRHWALVRRPGGTLQLALESREGELLALLADLPIGEALARLEASCSPEEAASLPERARRWLARSVEENFWSGTRFAEPAAATSRLDDGQVGAVSR